MFSSDLMIYSGDSSYISNCGWFGTLLIMIGAIMALFTVLIIYQIFKSENQLNYKGHG